jgi:hypothetical protein
MKICLADKEIVFEGLHRTCYVHPDDKNKILKVMTLGKRPDERRKNAPFFKKFRPLHCFDENLKDLKAYRSLAKKSDGVWEHFPKCFGLVETDLGNAICMELIRGNDGQIAPTVFDYLIKNGLNHDIKNAINAFCSFLLNSLIVTHNLKLKNLVIKKDIDYQIYMVDGVGNSDSIPIANFSKLWARMKIQRVIKRLKETITDPKRLVSQYGFSNHLLSKNGII